MISFITIVYYMQYISGAYSGSKVRGGNFSNIW